MIAIGIIVFGVLALILSLTVNALRKAVGLLFLILGTICCFTGIGIIIGIPMILVGGVLFFI